MRALLIVRADAAAKPGGDVVHAENAARALRDMRFDVTVVASDAPDARGYDVAHIFGIFEPQRAAAQIAAVRAAGVPLVLSPIWLDLRTYFAMAPEVERALAESNPARVERRLARAREREAELSWRGRAATAADRRLAVQRSLLLSAEVVLPASEIEAFLYGERLKVTRVRYVVAPLGVDDDAFAEDRPATRIGVLCAGRIESKKNQAALLYALRDVDVEVTLLGRAYDPDYLALCKRWATPKTRFVEHVSHAEVLRLMARAAVHAHPSWLESPGLSSLEAAATGARIVVGDRGSEREYFGPHVDYADPADPESIRSAVVHALESPPRDRGDALDRRLGRFTWENHAVATIDAYARAMVLGAQ
ncbi:MAG TPA: glycosyltransferase family 4 protein [Candidatus Elarobacter sp.]